MTLDKLTEMTFFRAQTLSRQSGIAWTLLDANDNVLCCDGTIAGFHPKKLAFSVNKHRTVIDQLFISLEPIEGVIDIEELVNKIEGSTLTSFTVYSRVPERLQSNRWKDWSKQWEGTVTYVNKTFQQNDPSVTVVKAHTTEYPWITSVSAADITGCSLSIAHIRKEGEYQSYVSDLVRESRAVLYTKSLEELVSTLPEENNMEEFIEYYPIDELDSFEPLIRHCRKENTHNAIAICDMATLSHLVDNSLVDEVVHHVTVSKPQEANEEDRDQLKSVLNLHDWNLLTSTIAGNSSRIVLRKSRPATLGRGLN